MFVYQWIMIALIQMLIGYESSIGTNNIPANGSLIIVPSPKVFYVNKNNTGKRNANKKMSKKQHASSSCGLLACDSRTSAIKSGLKQFHVKKFSEPRVDGNWGKWGSFGPQTKTCDEEFRKRTRLCNNPFPRGGGKLCEGPSEESVLFEFGRCFLRKQDTEFKMSNMGMWKHAEETPGFFWNVKFGLGEGITSTGPNRDATGDGYFLIADSSKRKREDRAVIISDELTPAPKVNRACLKFRYFMHGSNMGLLSVKIKRRNQKPKTIWRAFGEAGSQWMKAKVTLKSSLKFQVLFDAAIGKPELSDIALDNIYVDNGNCRCQDEYQSCREWALDRKCNSKHDKQTYYWMSKNCRRSCETCDCKDLAGSENCHRWEEEGFCTTYSAWMSINCQLSCRLCACHDYLDYSNCKARVNAFECETHPQLMADECRLSCGFCDCKNIAYAEECHRRMALGECTSNELYMSTNCKYTCGYCNCKNRYSKCKIWAAQGLCAKYSLWMGANCTLSCGKCRCHDTNVRCKEWKEQGECFKNPVYMNAFCQKSCGICKEQKSS